MPKLTKAQTLLRDEMRDTLRAMLAPNGTERKKVYSVNRHTSRSGMRRHLDFYMMASGGDGMEYLSGRMALALGYSRAKCGALLVDGCGMDMGFHVVYHLGAALWPQGTPAPHGQRNGEPDTAGGYALRHEWL